MNASTNAATQSTTKFYATIAMGMHGGYPYHEVRSIDLQACPLCGEQMEITGGGFVCHHCNITTDETFPVSAPRKMDFHTNGVLAKAMTRHGKVSGSLRLQKALKAQGYIQITR